MVGLGSSGAGKTELPLSRYFWQNAQRSRTAKLLSAGAGVGQQVDGLSCGE